MTTRLQFAALESPNGTLSVYESGRGVPFDIQRVFVVSAKRGDVRGHHAHKRCSQLLVCVSGRIRVTCDDGTTVGEHLLDDVRHGVLIPPGVWASEEYLADDSVLMVLCDRVYEEDDYIRTYQDFETFCSLRDN